MGIVERKGREKQMRRDLILQAAELVFFEKGLRATTLDEVAEKAEISKGTIYLYFASKEDLYYSLMTKGLAMLVKIFRDTNPEEKSPRDALLGFGEAYFKFSEEQSYLFKMLAAIENPVVNEQVSAEALSKVEEMSNGVLSYVAQFVQKGIEAGDFRKDISAYNSVILLWVSLSGVLNLKAHAAMVRQLRDDSFKQDSVLCSADYDLLYSQCMNFLTNFLNADQIAQHYAHRHKAQKTRTGKISQKIIVKKHHGTSRQLKVQRKK